MIGPYDEATGTVLKSVADTGLLALQMTMIESIARLADVDLTRASELMQQSWERHEADEPSVTSAIVIIEEAVASA